MRGRCLGLGLYALLMLASHAAAQTAGDVLATQPSEGLDEALQETQTAETILATQPARIRDRLMEKNVIVMQEIGDEGPLSGSFIMAYVIFGQPIDRTYHLLSQSARQIEFRPELTSIETIEVSESGGIDVQRLKILFQRYVYYLEYRLDPRKRRIEWRLDTRFDNDLEDVEGFWEFYAMADDRTLGRSGTSVNVGRAVPAFLQDWITRKNLPKTMERARKWVNSEGTWRP